MLKAMNYPDRGRMWVEHCPDAALRLGSASGERAYGSVPRESSGKLPRGFLPCRSTFVVACLVIEGSGNGQVFEASVEQILAPNLVAGQMVVLDNVSVHTGARVRQLTLARGCELFFLPAYSPDSSPIEETFSKRHPPFCEG